MAIVLSMTTGQNVAGVSLGFVSLGISSVDQLLARLDLFDCFWAWFLGASLAETWRRPLWVTISIAFLVRTAWVTATFHQHLAGAVMR